MNFILNVVLFYVLSKNLYLLICFLDKKLSKGDRIIMYYLLKEIAFSKDLKKHFKK